MTATPMHDHFATLARYNRWANRRLYAAVAALPDAEYRKARRAFFGSLHGTLNHLLVADRIWLGRIAGVDAGIAALDTILYDGLDALRAAREREDERIIGVVDDLAAASLESPLYYRTTAEAPRATPLRWVLSHLFNHQTHHRGQVHDMLGQTEVAPPPLDLIFFLREND